MFRFGVPLPILAPGQLFLLPVAILTFLMAGSLLFLVQRGYVRFASLSLSFALLVILTLIIINDGGVRAPSFSAYILLIVIASLLSDGRTGIGFAILSIVIGLGLLYAQNIQFLPPRAVPHTLVFIWLSNSVFFFMTAAILHRATSNLHNALDRAQRSEEKYRTLVENMSEGLLQVDLEGTIQFVNQRLCQIVDYTPEELTGRHAGIFFGKYNQQVVPEKIEQRRHGLTDKYEIQIRKKSNDEIWTSVSGAPITDEKGMIVGSLGIITDITARKQADEERSAHARFLALLNDITFAALESSDLQEMLQILADRLGELIDADGCYLTLWDEASQTVIPAAAYGELRQTYPAARVEPDEVTMTESVLRAERTLVAEDVFNTPYLNPRIAAMFPTRSLLGLPLIAGNQKLGAVLIGFDSPHQFSTDEITRCEQGVRLTALAIAKFKLLEAFQDSEAQATRARNQLEEAIESLTEAFALYDKEDRLVMCNSKYREFYPVDDPNVQRIDAPFEDGVRAGVYQGLIVDAIGREEEWIQERVAEHQNPKGVSIQQVNNGRWLRVSERKTKEGGIVGVRTDITELKQREQALAESELHYRSLFEGSPIALWELDFSEVKNFIETLRYEGVNDFRTYFENHPGAVRQCAKLAKPIGMNQAMVELYQAKDKADLLGGLDKIFREDTYPIFQEELVAIAEGKSEFKVGTINYTLTGDKKYIDVNWTAFPGYEKTLARMIVSIIDVTERRQLEEQLRQSQKMEAIGRLAGGIAHDFNNILTVIIGNSELALLNLQEGEPLYGDIKQISKMAERAAALTSQLLAFSRQQVLQPKKLNLNTVVGDMDRMLRRLIGENIELKTILDAELATVEADQGQIEQVILNLVVNARDVMPHGGKLTIETANVELSEAYAQQHVDVTPGPYVMLAISDTGAGMDEKTQDNIFEPFFTTKEQGKGTGLGLATVHGIVSQSGGHIKVYSQLGHSTTFKVYLPQADESTQPLKQRQPTAKTAQSGETILLVEDEDTVREVVNQVLHKHGYIVLEACDGQEALQIAETNTQPIHLLLTDVLMPGGLSGRQLAEQLKSSHPDLNVLYMSGYTDNVIAHHGVLDPNTAFIQKPFTSETLLYKVREVLDDE